MEPFNSRLQDVLMARWDRMDDDTKAVTIAWLSGDRPATVVRAMNYAERLADEVDETLLA